MTKKIRILITDDHFVARLGLSVPISEQPDMEVVGEAETPAESLAAYKSLLPDVVTMDCRIRDGCGIQTAAALLEDFPDARILMLSAFDSEEDIYRAAEAGVSGYLNKDCSCAQLLDSLRRIHAGHRIFPAAIAAKLALRKKRIPLTERELVILRKIVEGRSNKEISAHMEIGEPLVKYHVSRILEKMGASDRTHAAVLALERGLVRP